MHLLDTSTFLWRPRFSTFWHASLLISSSEQEEQRLNIWDHSFTRKNQQVSLWIMISFHLFPYFSISSPHSPKKIKAVPRWTKHLSHKIPGKHFTLFHQSSQTKSNDFHRRIRGLHRQVWCNWSHLLGHANTGWGKHVVFLLGIFGDIEKSCGSEYQRELLRNVYMSLKEFQCNIYIYIIYTCIFILSQHVFWTCAT